jgi:hypothetical protein
MSDPLDMKIGAHSVQLMLKPSGLIGSSGLIVKNLSLDAAGVRVTVPAELFPFLDPNHPALVVLSIVQIKPAEPKPSIILPGLS